MLKRGFKSQCERRSVEIRKTLSLTPICALHASALAKFLGVVVWAESDVQGIEPADIRQLTNTDSNSWSAFTIRDGTRHLVVYNSAQSNPRINSIVMHELSHITLGHELSSVGLTDDGQLIPTNYDQNQEDEADWLAGTLLLPRPSLLDIRHRSLSDKEAREKYQVSAQMLKWRFRMTGVDYQLGHRRGTAV